MNAARFLSTCSASMLIVSATSARAQQTGISVANDVVFVQGGMAARTFEVLDAQPLEPASVVKDAPFSAEAVTEFTQHLADGNRIERSFTSTIARDSQGRTRREEQIALIGPLASTNGDAPRMVTIIDPVSGSHYTLDDQRKVAHRMRPMFTRFDGTKADVIKELIGARGLSIEASSAGVRVADPLLLGSAPFEKALPAPDAKTEQLPARNIEGVMANGTRTTMTLAAGTIGNQLPIDVVTERWFSNELKVPVLITRRDPRSGETVYRLTNIVRAEPPPDLFTVPAGYQVVEGRDIMFNREVRKR